MPHRIKYQAGTLAVDGWAVRLTFGSLQRGGDWPRPLLAVPNVTAHPSTASVLITVLLWPAALRFVPI